jgi:hypothetical protein
MGGRLIRRYLTICPFTIGLLVSIAHIQAQALTSAQMALKAKVEGVPDIPYEGVPNFLKLGPYLYFGESVGVATNSKSHTFVYDRGHHTGIFKFDETESLCTSLVGGHTVWCSHVVKVDPQGGPESPQRRRSHGCGDCWLANATVQAVPENVRRF